MRFLQQDTMFGDTREPLTRNLYIYGNANPMTYVDPSGHYVAEPGGSFDTIEYGDKGYRVTQVQNGLNVWTATKGQAVDKNLPFIKADGDFGPKTKESVNVFKNVNSIYNKYSSNGVVDEITWKALKPYMGQSSGTGIEPNKPTVQSPGETNEDEDYIWIPAKKPGIKGYLLSSGKQLVAGNYTDDVTLLGTAAQVGTGLVGIDLPGDIRDLSADLVNWKWSWGHTGKTALDVVGLVPVVGAIKYGDEASTLIKGTKKLSKLEEVSQLAKHFKLDDTVFNDHILKRHGFLSTWVGKSKFKAGFDIKVGIGDTLKSSDSIIKPNTADALGNARPGYIFEKKYSYQIGVDKKGNPLYTLKVVINEAGEVVTAFPKK
jgi:peptidoglycan hydrolase-like protein with peptidoglycan-binding domain